MMQPPQQQQGFNQQQMYVWLKGLETKVNNLLREVDILKEDFMKKNGHLKQEVKTLRQDMLDQKHEQVRVQQKVDLIIKELKQTAGKEQLDTIKRYMEYWNPINFVTQRDLERAIETKLSERHHSGNKPHHKENHKKHNKKH
jgi:hypothetical protein